MSVLILSIGRNLTGVDFSLREIDFRMDSSSFATSEGRPFLISKRRTRWLVKAASSNKAIQFKQPLHVAPAVLNHEKVRRGIGPHLPAFTEKLVKQLG